MTGQLTLRQTLGSVLGVVLCCWSVACSHSGEGTAGGTAATTAQPPKQKGMEQPVASFRQVITSSKTELQFSPGQDTKIPVRIQNPGTETWASAGPLPIDVSYKWFKGGVMMNIEGERTVLPSAIAPNQTVDVDVHVVAPPNPGKYALRFSLVQEAVAWFMTKSNTFLELPVTVQ